MPPPVVLRRSRARWPIIAALLLVLAALSGCGMALKLGYGQGSALAFRWLDGYADFDDAQSLRVRAALDEWFAWNRRTQLPDYADALSRVARGAAVEHHAGARLRLVRRDPPPRRCRHRPRAAGARRGGGDADAAADRACREEVRRAQRRAIATTSCSAIRSSAAKPRWNARSPSPRSCTVHSTTCSGSFSPGASPTRLSMPSSRMPSVCAASRTSWRCCAGWPPRRRSGSMPTPRSPRTSTVSTTHRTSTIAATRGACATTDASRPRRCTTALRSSSAAPQ